MTTYSALREALTVWQSHEAMTTEERKEAAASLSEWHLFSNLLICKLTGLSRPTVAKVARKWEKTGGRFTPEALEDTLEITRQRMRHGVADPDLVAKVVNDYGVSTTYLAKLTGMPQRTIARMAGKA